MSSTPVERQGTKDDELARDFLALMEKHNVTVAVVMFQIKDDARLYCRAGGRSQTDEAVATNMAEVCMEAARERKEDIFSNMFETRKFRFD